MAAAFAVALAGCGGGDHVAWKGHPRVGPIEGGRMLFGVVVNHSGKPITLRAAQVRVVDRSGRTLPSAAVFAGGYNASIALHGFGAEMFAAAARGARTGTTAEVAPGRTVPLSVSWKGVADAVVVAGAWLPLH